MPHSIAIPDLDEGETDCIRIAIAVGLENSLFLIDDRAGRAVAKERFATLHSSDFRISAGVIKTVLESVDENR